MSFVVFGPFHIQILSTWFLFCGLFIRLLNYRFRLGRLSSFIVFVSIILFEIIYFVSFLVRYISLFDYCLLSDILFLLLILPEIYVEFIIDLSPLSFICERRYVKLLFEFWLLMRTLCRWDLDECHSIIVIFILLRKQIPLYNFDFIELLLLSIVLSIYTVNFLQSYWNLISNFHLAMLRFIYISYNEYLSYLFYFILISLSKPPFYAYFDSVFWSLD